MRPMLTIAILCTAWCPVAAAELDQQFLTAAEAMAKDAVTLRECWGKAIVRAAGDRGQVASLCLGKALGGKDLLVEVVRLDETWLLAEAWVSGTGRSLEVEDCTGLRITGRSEALALQGVLVLKVPQDLLMNENDKNRWEINLQLKTTSAELTGTYAPVGSVPVGATKNGGEANGRLKKLGPDFRPNPGFPVPKATEQTAFAAYALALRLETEACRRYADLLWMDGVVRQSPVRFPFGKVSNTFFRWMDGGVRQSLRCIPAYPIPVRPPFRPAGSEGGASQKTTTEGPSVDLGDDEQEVPARKVVKKGGGSLGPEAPARLAMVREIGEHLGRIRAVAERFIEPTAAPAPTLVSVPCADPQFGPHFGFAALAADKTRGNVIPADAGGPGRQEWRYVAQWRTLGPIPLDGPSLQCSALPHRFLLAEASYPVFAELLPRAKATKADDDDNSTPEPESSPLARYLEAMRWHPWEVEPGTGILRVPQWYNASGSGYGSSTQGLANTTWFAATTIHSETERELWVALGVDADAQLWLNDRLVAAWPDQDRRQDLESPLLLRLTLRRGPNTVLARVRQLSAHSCLWMQVCLRGSPLDKTAAEARDRRVAERQKTLSPFGPEVRGWRGNWLGVEPEARPVTAWDFDKRINVRWSTGLPVSISTPLLVGDRLICTANPHHLICLDKMNGQVRWRSTFDLNEILEPAVAATAKAFDEEYLELYRMIHDRAEGETGRGSSTGARYSAETITYGGKTMTLKEARERLGQVTSTLNKTTEAGLKKHGHSLGYLWAGSMSTECATPVTDGKHLWLRSATGAAACFSVDGERRWLVEVPHFSSVYNAFSSPLLVDGLFLTEVVADDKSRPGGGWRGCEWRDVVLLALDAATGKERWRAPVLNPIGTSSPVAMRLTNGSEDLAVVVTGGSGCARLLPDGRFQGGFLGGTVVRVSDGKVLIPNLSVNTGYGTPVAVGDVVYHCGLQQMTATRLIMVDKDTVGAQRLWTKPFAHSLEPCVTPWNGRLVANIAANAAGGQAHYGFGVLDPASGEWIPRHVNVDWPWMSTSKTGRCYIPTAVAGPTVFVADEGEGFGGFHTWGTARSIDRKTTYANCVAVEAKEQGRIIAQNALPPRSNSAYLFDQDRMYYRNVFGMMCLAYTGEEGKAFEAEVNARYVLEDLDLERPATGDAVPILPQAGLSEALPRQPFYWSRYCRPFRIVGPFAKEAKAGVMDALNGRGSWQNGIERPGIPIGSDPGPAFTPGRLQKRGRVAVVGQGGFGQFGSWDKEGGRDQETILFAQVVQVDRAQVVRFITRTQHPQIEAWLGGTRLKHQERYRLEPGEYVYVGVFGGGPASEDKALDFYFVRSAEDPQQDVKAWREDLAGIKVYLDRVVNLKPDCETSNRAREALEKMKSP